ncbi:Exosome complex exonuclease RRP42 [Nymphon striatum]|nr:Exosome complex exonuclease RRP42 [Nymphon striatum]
MATILLSESEKNYVLQGIQDDMRVDGRSCNEFREMVLELDVVSNTNGSAHLRLANTDVLVGVKAELETPKPPCIDEGRIEIFVDCSANANPEFEGRGGEELATEISTLLTHAYTISPECFDMK